MYTIYNMNYVLITAAGKGTRANLGVPKQFYEVNGRPLISYTLEVFNKCSNIDCIVLIIDKDHLHSDIIQSLRNDYRKIKYVVEGGETNQQSIFNALNYLNDIAKDDDFILIHDGVRCLVTEDIIVNNIEIASKYGNAITAIPCNEAMLYTEDGFSSSKQINRDLMVKTQTPHCVRFGYGKEIKNYILSKGINNSIALCTMIIEFGDKVYFSKGSNSNFKITNPEDIELFTCFLNSRNK